MRVSSLSHISRIYFVLLFRSVLLPFSLFWLVFFFHVHARALNVFFSASGARLLLLTFSRDRLQKRYIECKCSKQKQRRAAADKCGIRKGKERESCGEAAHAV
mmetsp:Transcript_16005/g.32458  ORF Transcript_16005/g.32458 Transcript_16005/m.32458 type:complete len:103 (+) Transcript_16005:1009-1317(+)